MHTNEKPHGLQEHRREEEKLPEAQDPASLAHIVQNQETLLSSDLHMSYTIHALPYSHTQEYIHRHIVHTQKTGIGTLWVL